MKFHQYNSVDKMFDEFKIKCNECTGLCCTALYFSKYDGFPADKMAGIPCSNLDDDFRCSIHGSLHTKHMKGCLAYDCCGAGQIVAFMYGQDNWKSNPDIAQDVYDVFIKTFYVQQMLWYLTEVLTLSPARELWWKADDCIRELHLLLKSTPRQILDIDTAVLGKKVNLVLDKTWEQVKKQTGKSNVTVKKRDLMGHNFKKARLNGNDFSSALLIAADFDSCDLTGCNFLGADLRDTNVKNADLSESIFLTQGQINAAIGNQKTLVPKHLRRPSAWMEE